MLDPTRKPYRSARRQANRTGLHHSGVEIAKTQSCWFVRGRSIAVSVIIQCLTCSSGKEKTGGLSVSTIIFRYFNVYPYLFFQAEHIEKYGVHPCSELIIILSSLDAYNKSRTIFLVNWPM